jgi:cutinase
MAANCPNTRMVLGGYSQGAGVIDSSTAAMPPQVADHVAAAALFGTASRTRRSGATRRHPAEVRPGRVNVFGHELLKIHVQSTSVGLTARGFT